MKMHYRSAPEMAVPPLVSPLARTRVLLRGYSREEPMRPLLMNWFLLIVLVCFHQKLKRFMFLFHSHGTYLMRSGWHASGKWFPRFPLVVLLLALSGVSSFLACIYGMGM